MGWKPHIEHRARLSAEGRIGAALMLLVLEKTLESLLDCKEMKPVNPKGNQSEYSLQRILELKLQYFGHLTQRAYSLEKTPILGKIEGRRRRG